MMSGLISIITACYKESPARIRRTMESITVQTYKDYELILIDGGSSKESIDELRRYPCRQLVTGADSGVYDAMNKGLSIAKGEWVMFMNIGDEYATKTALSEMISAIRLLPGYGWYYGDCYSTDGTRRIWTPMPKKFTPFESYHSVICHQTVITSRSLFDSLGFFDLTYKIRADHAWQCRAIMSGYPGIHLPVTICIYEQGGLSSRGNMNKEELRRIQKEFFPCVVRAIYELGWLWRKIKYRLVRQNYSWSA